MFQDYPDLFSVTDLMSALHIGRTLAYRLIRTGAIPSLRVGSHIRIPKTAVMQYVVEKTERQVYNVRAVGQTPVKEVIA